MTTYETFQNISQRVIFAYLKSLTKYTFVLPPGIDPQQQTAMEISEKDLHSFFQTFYQNMYQNPDLFGLPVKPDICLDEENRATSPKRQEVNPILKKPKEIIGMGIDILMTAGTQGMLDGQNLVLDPQTFTATLKKPKVARKFLQGLESAGLQITETATQVIFRNTQFPTMMPALQALALCCAQQTDAAMGRFLFTRCDFQAFQPGYSPDILALYGAFAPDAYARFAAMHHFFLDKKYKVEFHPYPEAFGWKVEYMGSKKVKSSRLLEVDYEECCKIPMTLNVKCASANRLTPFIPQQPQSLQDNFFQHANRCNGDACGWCKNRKGMGPSDLEYNGTQTAVCWFTQIRFFDLTDSNLEVIKQYALLHDQLER